MGFSEYSGDFFIFFKNLNLGVGLFDDLGKLCANFALK